ncbi:hypothetical protein C7M61_004470 [Candidozyma pseudohaemuli]|uniref:SH3 domain-containing protein n=1 Tax=Candidozyma pseudohaemuli TaxID=418784 RepID=A0A2P7YI87_9ASCO|nr:hypothetical protein C7M61_004470 [[Candida] pseudohaemulonii]PSK35681.1 hypothetical protein C7M61_004470 [[Candida] pseudohaemulonii]
MPPDILCPPNTTTTDYAYPESHPLHLNNYPTSQRSLISSSEDLDLHDFGPTEYDDDDTLGPEEINCKAVALFDFEPENDNEVALRVGQVIWISYRHGQGWLVAEDPDLGENGLVPEGYVEICAPEEESIQDEPKPFIPRVLQNVKNPEDDSDWEDTDFEDAHTAESPAIPLDRQSSHSRDSRDSKELTSLGAKMEDSSLQ